MPLDPLNLDKLAILQNEESPVNIRLHLTNITLTGIKDVIVTKVVLVRCSLYVWSFFSIFVRKYNDWAIFSVVLTKSQCNRNMKWRAKQRNWPFSENMYSTEKFWFCQVSCFEIETHYEFVKSLITILKYLSPVTGRGNANFTFGLYSISNLFINFYYFSFCNNFFLFHIDLFTLQKQNWI